MRLEWLTGRGYRVPLLLSPFGYGTYRGSDGMGTKLSSAAPTRRTHGGAGLDHAHLSFEPMHCVHADLRAWMDQAGMTSVDTPVICVGYMALRRHSPRLIVGSTWIRYRTREPSMESWEWCWAWRS